MGLRNNKQYCIRVINKKIINDHCKIVRGSKRVWLCCSNTLVTIGGGGGGGGGEGKYQTNLIPIIEKDLFVVVFFIRSPSATDMTLGIVVCIIKTCIFLKYQTFIS